MQKIIIFTSNEKGALVQMAQKLTEVLLSLGKDVFCYIPTIANVTIQQELSHNIVRYDKTKTPYPFNTQVKNVSRSILNLNPSVVIAVDNGTFTSQLGINLANKVKMAVVMHDAGSTHTSYNTSLRHRLKHFVEKKTSEVCNKRINWVITCSPSSRDMYCSLYPTQREKVYMLPLGPHMPENEDQCPPEINGLKDYYMFFGRIDKYKGINTLLTTYVNWRGNRKLVIAGSGYLQEEEMELINNDPRVILINRFIKDEEMPYLFKNCRAVILPYIEATQSGVLPIAYYCKKPVVSSDVIGISQFVQDGLTGYVCKSDCEYVDAYNKLEDENLLEHLSLNAYGYYKDNLDWQSNLKKMLQNFNL